MPKKILIWVLSIILFFVLFFGIGLLSGRNFYSRTKDHAKDVALNYFEDRDESVAKIETVDISGDIIYIGVITDKKSYVVRIIDKKSYVVRLLNNVSFLLANTPLSLVITPDVVILDVSERGFN
jgi:hypothetical protein